MNTSGFWNSRGANRQGISVLDWQRLTSCVLVRGVRLGSISLQLEEGLKEILPRSHRYITVVDS